MNEIKISDLLVKPLAESFSCIVCTELLMELPPFEAKQCSNGHCLCNACWSKQIETKKKDCPVCRVKIKTLESSLSRNLFLEKEFKKKKVYCKNQFKEERIDGKLIKDDDNGCNEVIKIEDIETHNKQCIYQFIYCPNNELCKERFRKNQLDNHNSICEYSKAICEHCKQAIAKNKLKHHYETECPTYEVTCQYCQEGMLRKELNKHHDSECTDIIVSCKYKDGGCEDQFPRKDTESHLAKYDNHIGFIQNIIDKHKVLLEESERSFKKLKTQHDTLEYKILNINKYNNQWTVENYSQKIVDVPNDEATATKRVSSPMFYFNCKKFNISLFPNGFTPTNINHISLYLHLHELNPNINIRFLFEIVNIDPTKSIKKEKTVYFQNDKGIGFEKFAESEVISKPGSGYVINNKLTIKFEIEIPQTIDSLTTK